MYEGIFFLVKVAILLFKSNSLCFMGNKHAQLTLINKMNKTAMAQYRPLNLKLQTNNTQQFTFSTVLLYLKIKLYA